MIEKISKELSKQMQVRENLIKVQREIIPLCAQAIRDVQKDKFNDAEKAVKRIGEIIKKTEKETVNYPEITDSLLGTAYQEYAELVIFLNYMKKSILPEIKIPAKYYLLGLGDAIGEMKRAGMELLAVGKTDEADKLHKELEDLYYEFSKNVYPNSVVPGLKQKQDAMRRTLNNLHESIINAKMKRI